MLIFCKDGIVGLEVVFLEELFAICDLHVKQGISDAENRVRRHCMEEEMVGEKREKIEIDDTIKLALKLNK